ncbi:MAG: helicase, partial [Microvirga sp.]|nr:helicase [Microvirga sp.]
PGVHVVTRPRLSQLTFAGEKKVSRLPRRTAIVAFSAEEVYSIAELIRRQSGGAAVVLGALSPRTRNAQVELYQSGDVDYLVATDAVGMGLNLDVDHVAFASDKKFDGFRFRKLHNAELAQIAGRAGRHMRDGTFGTTGRCPPFDAATVEALESHTFDPVRILQWRNPDIDFSSLARLRESLAEHPREQGLVRAPMGEDVAALELLAREHDILGFARSRAAVERLWQICQVPDYRKVSPQIHADLVGQIYRFLMKDGAVPPDWFSRHINAMDRTDGDIDTLSNRISQVRTWSFVANRPDWLRDPEHWQGVARQVEDKLSDALHERLAQRFVDKRTSVLMRRLREKTMLEAEITTSGDVTVEGQHIGHLHGFHFVPDPLADTAEVKTLRNAASKALAGEIGARADRFAEAPDTTLVLSNDGTIRWMGDPVARMEPGDRIFDPRVRILSDEHLDGAAREKVETRLRAWLRAYIVRLLGPLLELETSQDLTGLARGIAFQIVESLGVLERSKVLNDVRSLDQDARGALRKAGIRFGAYHLYLPALLKPAPRILAAQLWALQNGGLDQKGIDEIAHLAQSGRTSIPVDIEIAAGLYRAAGFRVCGGRAVRVDILERLADLIRPAISYRPGITPGEPPAGAADSDGFVATVAMTSLVGCAGDDFATILKSLGYASERRAGPAITVPLVALPKAVEPPVTAGAPESVPTEPSEVPTTLAPAAEAATEEPTPSADEMSTEAAVRAEETPETTTASDTAASADQPASEAATEQPNEVAPEPVLLDIWRQHRRHEGGHARPARGRPDRSDRRPRQGEAQGARTESRAAGEAPAAERPTGDRPPRRDRRPDSRPERREGQGDGGRPQSRPPRGPGRPDDRRGPRPEKRFDSRRDNPPERREKQPDPDSPFAKLLALKAQLEDGKK